MKLHLPKGLRNSLLACFCGTVAFTVATPAMAADLSSDELAALPALDNGRYWLQSGPYDMSQANGYEIFLYTGTGEHKLHVSNDGNISIKIGAWNETSNETLTKLGDGTLVITGLAEVNGGGHAPKSVNVSSGTLEIDFGNVGDKGGGFANTSASVSAGATLKLTASDALGYSGQGGDYVDTLTMAGAAASGEAKAQYATLVLTKNQTLSTNIVLNGSTRIEDGNNDGNGYFKTFGGSITADGSDNLINVKVTSEASDAKALELKGTGSLTISELLNSKGLTVGVNTTVTTYSGSGTIDVSKGNTLTIGNVVDREGNALSNSSLATTDGNGSSSWWDLLTKGSGEGLIHIQQTVNTQGSYGSSYLHTISGRYQVDGNFIINNWGTNSTDKLLIAEGGYLDVDGSTGMSMKTNQTLEVKGTLDVANTLKLGNGEHAPASLQITSDSADVRLGTLEFVSTSSQASVLNMSGGTLTLGSGGIISAEGGASYAIISGGTLKASADAGWTADSKVSVTLGDVIVDNGSKTIVLAGDTTFTDTVTNKGSLSLTGALYVKSWDNLSVGEGTYSEGDGNGFFTGSYWLVKNDNATSLNVTATTAQFSADSDADPLAVTVVDKGAYVTATTAGTDYYVATGETVYGADSTVGATKYILTGGTLSITETTKTTLPIEVAANSYISMAAGSTIGGAISLRDSGGDLSITSTGTATDKAYLSTDVDLGTKSLIIAGGYVRLGNSDNINDTYSLTAGTIKVNSGATLEFFRMGGDMSGTDVQLNGGNLHVQVIGKDGSGTLTFDGLEVTAASNITGSWGGTLSFSSLTGSGNLSLSLSSGGGRAHTLALSNADTYTGTLTVGTTTKVTVNDGGIGGTVNVAGGELEVVKDNATFAATSLTVSNSGTLTLLPTTLEQNVTLNGGTISMGNTTLSGTVTLSGGENVIKGDSSSGTTLASSVSGTADSLTLKGANGTGFLNVTGNIGHTGALVLEGNVELTSSASVANTVSSVTVNSGTAKVYGGGDEAAYKKFANGITVQNGATLHFTHGANENITMKGGKVAIFSSNSLYGSITLAAADAATAEDEATPSENTIIAGASGNVLSALRANVGGEGNLTLGESGTPTLNLYSTISNSGDVTIAGTVDMEKSASIANTNGSVKVTSGSLIVNSGTSVASPVKAINGETTNATISGKTQGTAPTYSGVTVTNSALTGGTVSDAAIDISGTFSIGSTVESSSINVTGSTAGLTLASGATIGAADKATTITVTDGATLSLAEATFTNASISINGSTLELAAVGQSINSALTLNGDVLFDLTGLGYTADTFSEGTVLLSDVKGYTETTGTVNIRFSDTEELAVNRLVWENEQVLVYFQAPVIPPTPGAIPEPTTTALSLLALAGLAARRRRRK